LVKGDGHEKGRFGRPGQGLTAAQDVKGPQEASLGPQDRGDLGGRGLHQGRPQGGAVRPGRQDRRRVRPEPGRPGRGRGLARQPRTGRDWGGHHRPARQAAGRAQPLHWAGHQQRGGVPGADHGPGAGQGEEVSRRHHPDRQRADGQADEGGIPGQGTTAQGVLRQGPPAAGGFQALGDQVRAPRPEPPGGPALQHRY